MLCKECPREQLSSPLTWSAVKATSQKLEEENIIPF
jgi:hypothetical protein